MLAQVINTCVDHRVHNVIADPINEHRQYGPVRRRLGFRRVAEQGDRLVVVPAS